MNYIKREKELLKDLSDWLGKDYKELTPEARRDVLKAYDHLTRSRSRDPLKTIHKIGAREFNYGILIIGSIYGITLSLLANLIGDTLQENLGTNGLAIVVTFLFTTATIVLMLFLKSVSRSDAKHWRLLEGLQEEARKLKASPNENRDAAPRPDHSPESTSSSDQS